MGIGFTITGVTVVSCPMNAGKNQGSLEDQQMLLTTELSLCLLHFPYCCDNSANCQVTGAMRGLSSLWLQHTALSWWGGD